MRSFGMGERVREVEYRRCSAYSKVKYPRNNVILIGENADPQDEDEYLWYTAGTTENNFSVLEFARLLGMITHCVSLKFLTEND